MHRRTLAVLTVAAVVALWGGVAAAGHAPATESTTATAAPDGAAAAADVQDANASVTFPNQTATDTTVTVENVTLPDGGYVTIHDETLLDGDAVGSVVGVSAYLDPGTYDSVDVTLFEGVPGADFSNDTAPTGETTLIAMPHEETTDDTTYDFVASDGADDGPYVTNGSAVVDDAVVTFAAQMDRGVVVENLTAPPYASTNETVTVNATVRNTGSDNATEDVAFRLEGGPVDVVVHQNVTLAADESATVTYEVNTSGVPEDEYIHGVTTYNSSEFTTIEVTDDAHVDIDNQTSDGTNVTVDDAFLPEGGYVAIHDRTLLQGDAVGSVVGVSAYLDPGYHEDVHVTLFEGVAGADFDEDAALDDREPVIAMPHLETNNNTTYDFVATDGEADGPYVTNGSPVVDVAVVTVGDGDGPGDGGPGDGAGDGEGDGQGDDEGQGEGEGDDEGQGDGEDEEEEDEEEDEES